MKKTWLLALPVSLAFVACQPPADEYRNALPDRDTIEVDVPAQETTAQGLGSKSSAIVGEPADLYTSTYYQARDLNVFGKFVVDLVETIASFPATELTETKAVWGPFSEEREPNEFKLTIEKDDVVATRFAWAIEGRHKSEADFITLARGSFEPTEEDYGNGWFVLDFDTIRTLDPSEGGRGRVGYAFEKDAEGVSVRVHFAGTTDRGERIEAGYAYGESISGEGFILFGLPLNVHEGPALEDVIIRTRWIPSGAGRADVIASGGDIGDDVFEGSQCWGDNFVSSYEHFLVNRDTVANDGEVKTCVLEQAAPPRAGELPTADDVEDPNGGLVVD